MYPAGIAGELLTAAPAGWPLNSLGMRVKEASWQVIPGKADKPRINFRIQRLFPLKGEIAQHIVQSFITLSKGINCHFLQVWHRVDLAA
jgi:hypothetical protein